MISSTYTRRESARMLRRKVERERLSIICPASTEGGREVQFAIASVARKIGRPASVVAAVYHDEVARANALGRAA